MSKKIIFWLTNIKTFDGWKLGKLHETKHPAKGERKSKERLPKYKPEAQQPKVSHKWGKGTIYVRSKAPTSRKKHIKGQSELTATNALVGRSVH